MTALALDRPKKLPRTLHRDTRVTFINSTEVYLRTIYEMIEEDGLEPDRMSLSRELGITRSAVSQHVDRMVREGLATVSADRRISLTDPGRNAATAIVRKHRLAERFLCDVVGLDWELCHVEAVRWQHVLGDDVERRLVGILDVPTTSPYGDPVPELDVAAIPERLGRTGTGRAVTLAGMLGDRPRRGRLCRILDRLQSRPDVLRLLRTSGAVPGATVEAERAPDGTIRVATSAGSLVLDTAAGRSVVVVPEPGPRQ